MTKERQDRFFNVFWAVALGAAFLFMVVVSFCGCSGYNAYLDSKYGPVTFTDGHGLDVASNGYPVDPFEFEQTVSTTLIAWQAAFDADGVNCNTQEAMDYVLRISWREHPFFNARWEGLPLYGLTNYSFLGSTCEVGFIEPLARSALSHELGHVLLGVCMWDYSEQTLRDFTYKYDLPY